MKRLMRNIGFAGLLIALLIVAIPVAAQGPVAPIPPDAQKERDRLVSEYQQVLEEELNHGETALSPDDGETIILVGNSAKKMEALWDETARQVEAVIARPAAERAPVESMIAAIDGTTAVYVSRSGFPYSSSVQVEKYKTTNHVYTIDIASAQILEIMPVGDLTGARHSVDSPANLYSQEQLEEKAIAFIEKVAGNVNVKTLQPIFSNKNGRNFFFRWEDTTSKLRDGMTPFIQVSLSASSGDVLNYVNTLPVAIKSEQTFLQEVGLFASIARATFQETYANGGTVWSWVNNGASASTTSNAGYCYIAGWCSPKNFYWAYTDATTSPSTPLVKGKWDVTPDSQLMYLDAFIPSTNATAFSNYTATYNNGANQQTVTIDQEAYSNVWVNVLGTHVNYGIVTLDNNDDIATYRVAWDEIILCTSDVCP